MFKEIEGFPSPEAEKEVLLTDRERNYLRVMVLHDQAKTQPGAPNYSRSYHEWRESLARKLE